MKWYCICSLIFLLPCIFYGQSAHAPFNGPPNGYVEEDIFNPSWLTDSLVQLGYFSVTLTGATPNDSTDDDTDAINHAIRLARDYRYVCFFPQGTYHVTNTLLGAFKSYESPTGPESNRWRNDRLRPVQLVGDCSGPHPIIRLKDNSPGFVHATPSDTTMKALLHIWAQLTTAANTLCLVDGNTFQDCQGHQNPDYESAGSNFNAWVRNLDFDLGFGNTNGVGVRFAGAQGCVMENSVIFARDGYAGFTGGLGSSGGYFNITVHEGNYGFVGRDPQVTTNLFITGAKFIDQSEAVFRAVSWFPFALVGIYVKKDNPRIFDTNIPAGATRFGRGGGFVSTRGVSLIDAVIDIENDNNDAAFLLNNGNNFYMENVLIKNVENIVGSTQGPIYLSGVGLSNQWRHITHYAHFRSTNPPTYVLYNYDDPIRTTDSVLVASLNVDSSLVDPNSMIHGHVSGLINAPCVFDVEVDAIASIQGIDTMSDQTAIQQAIDNSISGKILIPRGIYYLDSSLLLHSNTQLFGISNTHSVLRAKKSFHQGQIANPMITTDSDPNGQAVLADLYLQDDAISAIENEDTKNNKLAFIHWQQGHKSVVKDVVIGANRFYTNLNPELFDDTYYIKVSNDGGGRWYSVTGEHTKLRSVSRIASHRAFLIENTTQLITMYSFNWERAGTDDTSSAQVELRNAENITAYCVKTETGGGAGCRINFSGIHSCTN